jgi:hypothetical protein
VRAELDAIGRLLREWRSSKAQGRIVADLQDRTNDLTNEVKKGEAT